MCVREYPSPKLLRAEIAFRSCVPDTSRTANTAAAKVVGAPYSQRASHPAVHLTTYRQHGTIPATQLITTALQQTNETRLALSPLRNPGLARLSVKQRSEVLRGLILKAMGCWWTLRASTMEAEATVAQCGSCGLRAAGI
jgi:hypothetical protein